MSENKKELKFEAVYCDTLKKNPHHGGGHIIDIPIADYNQLKLIRTSLYEAIEALTDRQEHAKNPECGVNYAMYWIHYLLKHTELNSEYEGLSSAMDIS